MLILALECSANPASCAVIQDGRILGENFLNIKTTHSQTLLPMTENLLKSLNLTVNDIDVFTISQGPGSFTGLRIGISALKGLAFGGENNVIGVSTLEAMAYMFLDQNAVICATMDARCNQVYNALFEVKDGEVYRLCEDRAILCEELTADLKKITDKPIFICGDGAELYFSKSNQPNLKLASSVTRYQRASAVGLCAITKQNKISPEELLPVYLRLPQAERELKNKKEKK